ncbi:hypothetical protein Cni_G28366 [Canna indica]|uniref:Protein Lines C-terminal domain-containing protein n=1 Tax=Canna indica TaxID=4628 RepID=A0AAQ3L2V3_9LILI|nr:hypothetical protein Cni_G28366 [Canna indica]
MVGVPRLCNLIAGSLRIYLEPRPFLLTKESEKDLLLSLSLVDKKIKEWMDESEHAGDLERTADSHFHDTCSMHVEQHFEDENNCFMDITSVMVTFLGLESGFVRHMVGKIFLDLLNLLAQFRSKWFKFLHLLWISLRLAMSSISPSELPSSPIGSINIPDESWMHDFVKAKFPGIEDSILNISTFVTLLHSRAIKINLHMVTGLFQTFRNILKSIKHQNSDLEGAYVYLAMSSLLKVPWSWLNEIRVNQINVGKNITLGRKNCSARSTDMLAGIILQLICSLVEEKEPVVVEGVSYDSHVVYNKFTELVLKLLAGFFKHRGCDMSLSAYLKHKLLMLMTRLRFCVQCDVSHTVLWLKLIKHNFEDLLYMPISVCDVGSTTIGGSPFLASSNDGDKLQNICTQHLQRQTIFLFLHCCFRLIRFNNEAGHQFLCGGHQFSVTSTLKISSEYCTGMGSIELFEWLQKCTSLKNILEYESFRKSCCSFASSFLQFYMEEDDMLFDILLQLLDAPVISLQICSSQEETSFEERKKDIIFIISSIFNPIYLFHIFLSLLHYDHLVLVDYLISKDTGIRFLQYLLRCLRIVCTSWHIFAGFSICESEQSLSSYKRRKISMDEKLGTLPLSSLTSGHKVRMLLDAGDIDKSIEPLAFEKANGCLLNLKKTVEDLNRKDLFPYNPKPLLRSLTRFQDLCNQ